MTTITDEQIKLLRANALVSRLQWYETLPRSGAMPAIADAETVLALLERLAAAEKRAAYFEDKAAYLWQAEGTSYLGDWEAQPQYDPELEKDTFKWWQKYPRDDDPERNEGGQS